MLDGISKKPSVLAPLDHSENLKIRGFNGPIPRGRKIAEANLSNSLMFPQPFTTYAHLKGQR
jgi:hypothetical protein